MHHAAPLRVNNSLKNKQLVMQWPAEEPRVYSHERLRGACPCAKCRAENIHGYVSLVNADVEIIAINPMGYGVQFVFNDGHDRGIYPWSYLHNLGI